VTIAVTGASGHVGVNLVRALLARGERVRALIHQSRQGLEGLDVESVHGSLGDAASLERAFAGAETVYHAAGYISLLRTEWPLLERTNVIGARNVVNACLACGVERLVHFSSIHALVQEPLDVPVDESRPLVNSHGCPPYDRSKAAGEREVRQAIEQGLNAVILYPTAIIGPYDFGPSHIGEALLALATERLPALVESGFDWVDPRDVSLGAIRAAEQAPAGARYLLSGHWASVRRLAELTHEITGARIPRFTCPLALARVGAPFATAAAHLTGRRPLFTSVSLEALRSNRQISHARATRDLGYQPRPLAETLRDTFRWFAEHGALAHPPLELEG
jgi:dihydroflavonol-4-reductase